jgi:CheY-like chemotaxis protein/GAF domain-containing protein
VSLDNALTAQQASTILESISQCVAVVDPTGNIIWSNKDLQALDPDLGAKVSAWARELFESFDGSEADARERHALVAASGDRSFELTAAPIRSAGQDIHQLAILISDATRTRRIRRKIDAIDSAGRVLVRLDAQEMAARDVTERLALLEDKIVRVFRELMHFSNFAIWLLDRRTGKLELLINYQLPPEAVEVELFASTEGNGIVGYVAATGRSYICPDVQQDPRYLPGLQRAASSLTVPMTLDNQVIGVLDVESVKQDAFTDDDRQFAEIFGRYVAIALNTFDLLVTEQVTTTGKLASNVQSEIAAPLNDIITDAATLMEDYIGHDDLRHRLQAICDNVMLVKKAVQSVAEHKAGILGRRGTSQVDPVLNGRRVLVADDEDAILETISEVLANYGCDVETARDGADAVSMIASRTYDAVLSDIKMPNRSGYEVFAAAKDRRPDCAVILMTGFGYDPNHSIIRARREGLSAVLFKPFKVDQLISELRSALQAQVTS